MHCPKTAGTSFKKILADNSTNDAEILMKNELKKAQKELRKGLRGLIAPHWGLGCLTQFNVDLDKYHVITFVRNPWDRFISLFKYVKSNERPNHPLHKAANSVGIDRLIEHLIIEGKGRQESLPQHRYYEAHFKVPNLHVIKSENFDDEIIHLAKKFDLHLQGIPHLNETKKQQIKLSKRIESLVYYHEFKTIEKFNYVPNA